VRNDQASEQALALVEHLRSEYYRVVVAFSGGVDSAVVAAAAFRALGSNAVAWTSLGAAVPEADRASAMSVARSIGIDRTKLGNLLRFYRPLKLRPPSPSNDNTI
jgi:uncharacterized protein